MLAKQLLLRGKRFPFSNLIRRNYQVIEHPSYDQSFNSLKVDTLQRIGLIEIDRKISFNALNLDIIDSLHEICRRFTHDPYITCFDISSSSKNFSIGDDLYPIFQEGFVSFDKYKLIINYDNMLVRKEYFKRKYQLVYALSRSKKPVLGAVGGLCLGSAMGISASINSILADLEFYFGFPATEYCLFPDTGCAYYLSRMNYNMGMFYALTGLSLSSFEAYLSGMVKHSSTVTREVYIDRLKIYAADPNLKHSDLNLFINPANPLLYSHLLCLANRVYLREQIMDAFSADDVETILFVVRKIATNTMSHKGLWMSIYSELLNKPPLALKITHRYLKKAKTMTYSEVLQMDYRIMCRLMKEPDFYNVVHSSLILNRTDKPPALKYKYLDDITDEKINQFFEPLPDEPDINLSDF